MNIFTLNIGQGQFAVVTGETEAFIVDTFVPSDSSGETVHVKSALARILSGKELIGLVVTGFDDDHFSQVGLKIVLNKYRPNWIMYPKYFKETSNAGYCFRVIKSFESQTSFPRHSISLADNKSRFYYKISKDFYFEIFSPHAADMTSSNNCSLVCKMVERSSGLSYLITGDTENGRWDSIAYYFGESLKSDVLDAPHHGSKNGISAKAMALIKPHTVLISAGVDNQYGHPDKEALQLFRAHSLNVFSTSGGGGQSLKTVASKVGINTYKFE